MTLDERLRALLTVAEFRDLTTPDRAALAAAMREEEFTAGEIVIAAGEVADRVFVLCGGRLSVTQAGRTGIVRELTRGALLGELAFFADEVRTATVAALTDCTLLSLPFDNFRQFLLTHPHGALILAGRIVRALRSVEAQLIEATQSAGRPHPSD